MATPEPVAYGYVAVPLVPQGPAPFRGQVLARHIDGAWHEALEELGPKWKLAGHYKLFVYSWSRNPTEYQAANVIVEVNVDGRGNETASVEVMRWPAPGDLPTADRED